MKNIFPKIRSKRSALVPPIAGAEQLTRIAQIIADADHVHNGAFLSFTGDKRFLFSETGRSFIMFGIKGRAWISVGPAIGHADETAALEIQFMKLARSQRAFPAFYGITESDAARLEQAGLMRERLGEKAILSLDGYSFSGRGKRDIRSARNKAVDAGCRFGVMDYAQAQTLLPSLRAISDNWLSSNAGSEKKFSLGWFDESYLQFFKMAVVFKGDEPIAFANLWMNGSTVVIDMMRYISPAQPGLMDYLFMEIITWAQGQSYQYFDMGAAPLSGLREQPSPTAVGKLGGLIFIKGGKFYNFTGIRKYKNKFDPQWTPLYICAKSSLRAGAAAVGIASLTGTGLRKMLSLGKLN